MIKFRCNAYRFPPSPNNEKVFTTREHPISKILNWFTEVVRGLWAGDVHTVIIERIDDGAEIEMEDWSRSDR